MERGFNAKQTRHCEEDRRKNTRRRRQNKKQERKRKREELTKETNNEGNISTEAPCLANEQMVASGETSSFEMKELQRLKEENNRLHKHAVYFHYQWKKSEEKAKSSGNLKELDRNHLVIDEEIGEGTFGLCYRATYGTIKVAVKEIKSASLDKQMLKNLRYYRACVTPVSLYFSAYVLTKVPTSSLRHTMVLKATLSRNQLQCIMLCAIMIL